jgi:hypothetical protein
MNNFYYKVALGSVCTVLAFTLGADKEVKTATFTLTSTTNFYVYDFNQDDLGDVADVANAQGRPLFVGKTLDQTYNGTYITEYRTFYDFNIANLPLTPNTVIRSAILQTGVVEFDWYGPHFLLAAYGTNEGGYNASTIFDAGDLLDAEKLSSILQREPVGVANFNVLPFIKERIRNNETFARFGIRNDQRSRYGGDDGYITVNRDARLILTTESETVPEPITIFGSAIGLCLGGWLKRKKSTPQNKAKS